MNSSALQVLPAEHVRDDDLPSPSSMAVPSPLSPNDGSSMAASTSTALRSEKSAKKSNPLIDLIETEKQYVDLLASIIRRVAAAWSKDNFPPKELDTMFRCVETIYKANRALLARLKDIGPNPSSPKALGDLLMRWIDDLEDPYERYCSSYITGFDGWPPVQQNQRVSLMLEEVSNTMPPAQSGSNLSDGSTVTWTIDSLFLLPRGRLKYYKRLYSRLLKSTQPGRSDHRLLVVAVEKLDHLLDMVAARLQVAVDDSLDHRSPPNSGTDANEALTGASVTTSAVSSAPSPSAIVNSFHGPTPSPEIESASPGPSQREPVPLGLLGQNSDYELPAKPPDSHNDARAASGDSVAGTILPSSMQLSTVPATAKNTNINVQSPDHVDRNGHTPSALSGTPSQMPLGLSNPDRDSSSSGTVTGSQSEDRSSRDTGSTSLGSLGSLPSPSELERKLSVDQVLDIFSMKPKACSLQLNPPDLPFTRSTRASLDLVISCTPMATGVETRTDRGHIYLLSDLLLICEKMSTDDAEEGSANAPAMKLLYPPLAGRFIRIVKQDVDDGNIITMQLLRKVTLVFRAESRSVRDKLFRDLEECIALASNLPSARASKSQTSASTQQNSSAPSGTPASLSRSTSEPLGPNVDSGPRSKMSDAHFPSRPSLPVTGHSLGHNSLPPVPPPGNPVVYAGPNFAMAREPNGRSYPPRDASLASMGRSQQPGPSVPIGDPGQHPLHRPPQMGPNFLPYPAQQLSQPGNYPPGHEAPYPRRDDIPRPPFPQSGAPPYPQMFNGRGEKPLPPHLYNGGFNGQGHGPFPPDMPRAYADPATFPSPTASIFVPPSARSTVLSSRSPSLASSHPSVRPAMEDISPPSSPGEGTRQVTAVISAQMKCKIFLKQAHSQWKSLGGAKLKLYEQQPTNLKQLVVEADTKEKTLLISTIILTDAVERVGKTGVAIELSDKGASTGIVYMIQLRNEASATGLFNSLLAGSDRTTSG